MHAVSYHAPRAITASGLRIDVSKKNEIDALAKRRATQQWQTEAWEYYDLIGEIKYAANLLAAVTSRVRIYPGWITDNDTAPSNINDIEDLPEDFKKSARDAVTLLSTGNGGTAGLLRDAALNLFVAGECYLVRESSPDPLASLDVWQIRSVDEVVVKQGRGKQLMIKESRSTKDADLKPLPGSVPFVGRIWRTHPRYSAEADSSLLGILELCDQLLLYSRATRGVAKSRLNAGILFIPEELSNISQGDGDLDAPDDLPENMAMQSDDDSDSFEEELLNGIITPISDESSAASVAPTVIRGPADVGDKIRHIKLERSFDPQISRDAERTLERILSALDLPKDVVSGMASVKYSNAITIEESLYKAHVEPLILMIVDALTVVFFRQILRSKGYDDELIQRATLWYDPSAITTKPDKATAATTGYEMKAISAEAWRRANGFNDSDAPTGLELIQRLAGDKGLLSEPVVEAALRTLAPELFDKIRSEEQAASEPGALENVQNALDGNPETVPDQPASKPSDGSDQPKPPVPLIEP